MNDVKNSNYAFIDGQNLHLGVKADGWNVDLNRLRTYLCEKYHVGTAHYFLGVISEDNTDLYTRIQKAGFILQFREHNPKMAGAKKGNVDTDVVFEMMKTLIEEKSEVNIVLVSGDGDYKKVVDYIIKKNRFLKILFPNKRYSSLYKQLTAKYFDRLGDAHIREKIEQKKRRT
jgi:uncharacterized LabA/DUF88 family protein